MDTTTPSPLAVACSLAAADVPARLSAIAQIGRDALIDVDVEPGRARLRFAAEPGVRERLAEIVEAEARCCAFLGLDLEATGDPIALEVRAPEEAQPALEEFVAAFARGEAA